MVWRETRARAVGRAAAARGGEERRATVWLGWLHAQSNGHKLWTGCAARKTFHIGNLSPSEKMELRSIEGTNPAPASHSQHAASQTRKRGPQCALFRVSNRIGNGQLVEDLALPSFARTAQAPHTRAAKFARARPTAAFAWNGRLACWSNAHGHPALHPCMNHHASHTCLLYTSPSPRD